MNKKKIFEFKITKKYSALLVLLVLLSFLTSLEIILISVAFKNISEIVIPLIMLTFYLVSVYRTFFWYLFGKEHIEITHENLIISKKGTFFVKPKIYNYSEIKNIRFENRKCNFGDFFVSRRSTVELNSYGCIVFNYKNKSINFGEKIDSEIASEIIEILNIKAM